MSKIKLISSGLLLVFITCFYATSKANAFLFFNLPKVYVSGGFLLGEGGVKGGEIQKDIKKQLNLNNSTSKNNSWFLSAGVEPNLPVPFLSGLRGELQYKNIHNKNIKGNGIGVGLYYDVFKFIPFVTPYVGASIMYLNAKTKIKASFGSKGDNISLITDKADQSLLTFSAGANVYIPLIPVTFFAEYDYTTSNLIGPKLNIKGNMMNNINLTGSHYSYQGALVGIRYYIL